MQNRTVKYLFNRGMVEYCLFISYFIKNTYLFRISFAWFELIPNIIIAGNITVQIQRKLFLTEI